MKKRIFGEVIASLESGERTDREAANSACLRELRRNNQARGVVCTPRAWMCLNGGALERIFNSFSDKIIGRTSVRNVSLLYLKSPEAVFVPVSP